MQPNDILTDGGILLAAMYVTSQAKPWIEAIPWFGPGQKLHDSALQGTFLLLNLLLALGYAAWIGHTLTLEGTPSFLFQVLLAFIAGGHVYSTVTTKGDSVGDSKLTPQQTAPVGSVPTAYPIYPPDDGGEPPLLASEPVPPPAPPIAPASYTFNQVAPYTQPHHNTASGYPPVYLGTLSTDGTPLPVIYANR
jgi:hypothetical protein